MPTVLIYGTTTHSVETGCDQSRYKSGTALLSRVVHVDDNDVDDNAEQYKRQ